MTDERGDVPYRSIWTELRQVSFRQAWADIGGVSTRYVDAERRGHAAAMVTFATRIGRMYSPRNRFTERVRDAGFRALQLVPGGKEYILQMKYKPMPRYERGIVLPDDRRPAARTVGQMFSQPVVEREDGQRVKLDEVLGPWFAVLGVGVDPRELLSDRARQWWDDLGARAVHVLRARPALRPDAGETGGPWVEAVTAEDVDGAFRDWRLANPGDEVIVLRPDRYVAAITDRAGLEAVTWQLQCLLEDGST